MTHGIRSKTTSLLTTNLLALALVVVCTPALQAQLMFNEVGESRGMLAYETQWGVGAGGAAADFDNDGDIDLFVPTAEDMPHQLYRNLGDGTFEEIAVAAGVGATTPARMALWFDYDGDGRLDLLTGSDCWSYSTTDLPDCVAGNTYTLYRQVADAQFQDVTEAAGMVDDLINESQEHRGGMAAGDLNNDGYIDVVAGLWRSDTQIWRNNGDGTFTDIRVESGVGGEETGHHWQPVLNDFNEDGWLDIFYAIEFIGNELWINQGDETFVNVAVAAGADNAMNDMGVGMGDFDNDGDVDTYVTNVAAADFHNVLMRNESVGDTMMFDEVAEEYTVNDGHFGWGATFFDADNDGDMDLAATNGFTDQTDPSVFWRNDGGPTVFTEVAAQIGFNDTYWGSALMAADFDRDGLMDMFQVCNGSGAPNEPKLRILENQSTGTTLDNNFLVIKPRMNGPNQRAIGARVVAEVGGVTMTRVITAGISFGGQEPAEAHFGLGSATQADKVTIYWPSGQNVVSSLADVSAGQVKTVDLLFADGFESGNTLSWSATN